MTTLPASMTNPMPDPRAKKSSGILPWVFVSFGLLLSTQAGWSEDAQFFMNGKTVLAGNISIPDDAVLDGSSPWEGISQGNAATRLGLDLTWSFLEASLGLVWNLDSLEGMSLYLDQVRLGIKYEVLDFEAGLLRHSWGPATVFGAANILSSQDFSGLLREGLEAQAQPEYLVRLGLQGEAWSASLLFTPFEAGYQGVPVDSVWFPRRGIPSDISAGIFTFTLSDIRWNEAESGDFVWNPGIGAEGHANLGPLDLGLQYFWGPDRQYTITALLDLNPASGTYNGFDILLSPQTSLVHHLGIALSVQVETLNFYAEAAQTWNRIYPGGIFTGSGSTLSQSVSSGSDLVFTGGLRWMPESPDEKIMSNLVFAAEWHDTWFQQDMGATSLHLLHEVFTGMIQSDWLEGRLKAQVLCLVSGEDGSGVVLPALGFSFGNDQVLTLSWPFFWGEGSTELGQFAGVRNVLLTLNLQWN